MACHQMGARRPTIRDLSPTSAVQQQHRPPPAAWFLEDDDDDGAAASSGQHFLDECRMCGRYLHRDRDIYMYKGDTAFCSEDCRGEQIRIDQHEERARRRRRPKVALPSAGLSVKPRVAAVAVGAV